MTLSASVALTPCFLAAILLRRTTPRSWIRPGSGVVPVNDEKLVVIRGVEGEVILQNGDEGNDRVRQLVDRQERDGADPARALDRRRSVRLRAPERSGDRQGRLRVVIPPAMGVRLEVHNATIHARQLDSELTVRGSKYGCDAAGLLRRAEYRDRRGQRHGPERGAGPHTQGQGRRHQVGRHQRGRPRSASAAEARGSPDCNRDSRASSSARACPSTRSRAPWISGFKRGRRSSRACATAARSRRSACPLVLSGPAETSRSRRIPRFSSSIREPSFHIENSAGGVTGDSQRRHRRHRRPTRRRVSLTQINGQLRVAGDELEVKLEEHRSGDRHQHALVERLHRRHGDRDGRERSGQRRGQAVPKR